MLQGSQAGWLTAAAAAAAAAAGREELEAVAVGCWLTTAKMSADTHTHSAGGRAIAGAVGATVVQVVVVLSGGGGRRTAFYLPGLLCVKRSSS